MAEKSSAACSPGEGGIETARVLAQRGAEVEAGVHRQAKVLVPSGAVAKPGLKSCSPG